MACLPQAGVRGDRILKGRPLTALETPSSASYPFVLGKLEGKLHATFSHFGE